ncbi:putative fad dependent oxidoreductase [Podospora australis]|uniref:Fad dependent oxidoreductase n=1 Tax=Podospora australis TaxID=1536484 RepID=A0AAN7ABT0_9PEZI|nr:putative fad dependent oxidoreductase [Podospora australis]
MEERPKIPVPLPVDNPTQSYWQDPPDPIADIHTTESLPASADTVIIGSGITGAAVAWDLLQRKAEDARKNQTIVMLEARQTCSGATGRNGGHTKAASYRTFPHHASTLGLPAAVQIARLELANILAVHEFARHHNIDCDLCPCDTIDVIYDVQQWEEAQAAVALMRETLGENNPVAKYTVLSPEEVKANFYCHDHTYHGREQKVYGGVVYFAGSLSAYKFTIGVIKLCLERGLNLQTSTPALELMKDDTNGRWTVRTPRGEIKARRVVLATNGYTASILPQKFQGVVVPVRGQIEAHRPGAKLPMGGCLPTTYSFIYEGGGFEYMIPRPKGSKNEGDIIMGGGLLRAPEGGLMEVGEADDAAISQEISEYLTETTPNYFGEEWGEDDKEGRVRKEWTGVMGFGPDGFPFVGEVPDEKGLWVSSCFQGHGMVLCWKSAEGLVEMMEERDGEGLREWFPDAFRISEERLGKKFRGIL